MSRRYLDGAAAAILSAAILSAPVQADVTLRTLDGSISFSGDIVGIEGNTITLRTSIGIIPVDFNLVTCEGAECPVRDELNQEFAIGGSDLIVASLLPVLIEEYAVQNDADPGRRVGQGDESIVEIKRADDEIMASVALANLSPENAFGALQSGDIDIAVTSRRITNNEIETFIDQGLGDLSQPTQEIILAQDGLVFVVSPTNPVDSLSFEELEGIFSGRISNWSEVGGPDLAITAYAPDAASGESEFFFDTVLDPAFSDYAPDIQRIDDIAAIADRVAGDNGGIGLTSSSAVRSAKLLDLASECGIVVSASPFTIKSEDYPLSRRLYAYRTSKQAPSHLTGILNTLDSEIGQNSVEFVGLTSLRTTPGNLDTQGRRLAYALTDPQQNVELPNLRSFSAEVLQADRMSTTFRFATGSSQLDNKSRADIRRLLRLLNQPALASKEVLLIGFTDSIGRSDTNTVLSERRAQQVLDEMIAQSGDEVDPGRFRVLGYGASAPVACNSSEFGRQQNRRVEVWVR